MSSESSLGNQPDLSQRPWPPGCAGAVASFIYQNAQRPVPEVAIVGALGLFAGLCGRQWNIPGSGLNCYIILVARSAIGKEAMSKGLAILQGAILQKSFTTPFVIFDEMASGVALNKAALISPCFVQVASEFGETLLHMANDSSTGPMSSLRKTMMRLYSKSGAEDVAGGIRYSNQDNNVDAVTAVSYSMIGETTPGNFYKAISSDMLANGFMSRFTVVEYEGERPPRNGAIVQQPWSGLVAWLAAIATHARTLEQSGKTQMVDFRADAQNWFNSFEEQCDSEIALAGTDESRRQMWNRANLKALRIAALLAVADNHIHPVVSLDHAQWATDLILRDIGVFRERMQGGDVGGDDKAREEKMKKVIYEYMTAQKIKASYGVPPAMHQAGVVPYDYLLKRLRTLPQFDSHKLGATNAVKLAIQSLADGGYISEVWKENVFRDYNFQGKCYRLARALAEFKNDEEKDW